MKIIAKILFVSMMLPQVAVAQDERNSTSIYLTTPGKVDVIIPFSFTSAGTKYQPEWGLDMAAPNEQILARGYNHMGKSNVSFVRSSYRVSEALRNDVNLATSQLNGLMERTALIDKFDDSVPLILNCDNGFDLDDNPKSGSNIHEYYTKDGHANIDHWSAMLNAHVGWMQRNKSKHPILGVSIMNEPDFPGNDNELIQGTAEDIRDIAKKLRTDYTSTFDGKIIMGCNTLNDDKALSWYNTAKNYIEWGNTHQLAGTFDNYVSFHQQLATDGKVGCNDELHNVAEAFIGLEYGMTKGIWWGFDGRARGEFCQISREGSRLAYGEHRDNWTAGCVYRNDQTGALKAFLGESERQSVTTSYRFVSLDDAVYYDGQGPYYEFNIELPGGDPKTYQTEKHTNAERVIDITYGDDIVPRVITKGDYLIMNYYNRKVIGQNGDAIILDINSNSRAQQWAIEPVNSRVGGDFSYFHIKSLNDGRRLNVLNHSCSSATDIIAYNANGDINEQWYFEYAGSGCYYIRNRESALYLGSDFRSLTATGKIKQYTLLSGQQRDRLLWRILPVGSNCETTAPAVPQNFSVKGNAVSVALSWAANTDDDIDGYTILRRDLATDRWNTIARRVHGTSFVDNTCRVGQSYAYKIRAVDKSDNQSANTDSLVASPTGVPSLVACWQFDGNAYDLSENMMDGITSSGVAFTKGTVKRGINSLVLSGSGAYVRLPYSIVNSEEVTITMWVNWRSADAGAWQRIFDFGYDTQNYMFLTPMNGANGTLRFAIKNGGGEQVLDAKSSLPLNEWKHVALVLGKDETTLYLDGEKAASTTNITIKPNNLHTLFNYIGKSQFDSDPYFCGYLDDMRIFNSALDQNAVKETMSEYVDGVKTIKNVQTGGQQIYGLDGRRYQAPHKGIRIVDGKKIVK